MANLSQPRLLTPGTGGSDTVLTTQEFPVNVRSVVRINGKPITVERQITRWTCKLASYGSPGTFQITTSITNSPDLIGIIQQAIGNPITNVKTANNEDTWRNLTKQITEVEIFVGYVQNPQSWNLSNLQKVFHGFIDQTQWIYDRDELIITGRDFSGLLMDSRAFVVPKYQENHTVSYIATQYATEVGLTPIVEPNSQLIGTIYKADQVHSGVPRTKWDILLYLARQVGYEMFVDPHKILYFGPPPKPGLNVYSQLLNTGFDPSQIFNNLTFYWKHPEQRFNSIKSLNFKHNPRRNKTFQILVKSYHPQSTQIIEETITVLGEPIQVSTVQSIAAGTYRGQANQTIFNLLSNTFSNRNVPVYVFHADGLDRTTAQHMAESIAADIAKREFLVDCSVLGNAAINPHSTIKFVGVDRIFSVTATGNIKRFEGIKYYPTAVEHSFGVTNVGYETRFQAFNIPASATADPNQIFEAI